MMGTARLEYCMLTHDQNPSSRCGLEPIVRPDCDSVIQYLVLVVIHCMLFLMVQSIVSTVTVQIENTSRMLRAISLMTYTKTINPCTFYVIFYKLKLCLPCPSMPQFIVWKLTN